MLFNYSNNWKFWWNCVTYTPVFLCGSFFFGLFRRQKGDHSTSKTCIPCSLLLVVVMGGGGRVSVQSAYFYSPTPAPWVKYILANFSFQKRIVKQPIRYLVIRAPSYWLSEGPVLLIVVKFKCSVEMPQFISFFLKITGSGDQKSCSGGRKRSQSVLKTTAICKTR